MHTHQPMLTPFLLASALLQATSPAASSGTHRLHRQGHGAHHAALGGGRHAQRHVAAAQTSTGTNATSATRANADHATPAIAPVASSRFVSIDMNLPALGTDRRVVLADMRKELLKNTQATGSRLVFNGGPAGWRGVESANYDFDGTVLERIELVFRSEPTDAATRELFLDLRSTLAKRNGSPSFDRVRDGDASLDRGIDALATQKHATTWAAEGVKTQVVAAYGDNRAVRVIVSRDPHTEAMEAFGADDGHQWAVADLSKLQLAARAAADTLFDDFGEQPTVIEGAKKKGSAIAVRLRTVNIPKGLASVKESTVMDRFDRFADGHWDVDAVKAAKDADIELVVDVLPGATADRYTMRLSAVIAQGKRRGETLYTALQTL